MASFLLTTLIKRMAGIVRIVKFGFNGVVVSVHSSFDLKVADVKLLPDYEHQENVRQSKLS